MSKHLSGRMPEFMSDRMSRFMSDKMSERMSESMSDRMSEFMSDRMSEFRADRISEFMSGRMSKIMPDRTSELMSDWISEWLTGRMSGKKVRIYVRQNVWNDVCVCICLPFCSPPNALMAQSKTEGFAYLSDCMYFLHRHPSNSVLMSGITQWSRVWRTGLTNGSYTFYTHIHIQFFTALMSWITELSRLCCESLLWVCVRCWVWVDACYAEAGLHLRTKHGTRRCALGMAVWYSLLKEDMEKGRCRAALEKACGLTYREIRHGSIAGAVCFLENGRRWYACGRSLLKRSTKHSSCAWSMQSRGGHWTNLLFN